MYICDGTPYMLSHKPYRYTYAKHLVVRSYYSYVAIKQLSHLYSSIHNINNMLNEVAIAMVCSNLPYS